MQCQVAEKAAGQGMSVRQVEQLVSRMTSPREAKTVEEATEDPNVKAAIQEMERVLGTRVRIVEKAPQRGRIEIDYYSMEDVHRIYEVIVGDEAKG
jgi:ParB family chromosome partitioning protein